MYLGLRRMGHKIIEPLIKHGGDYKNILDSKLNFGENEHYLYYINNLGEIDSSPVSTHGDILSSHFQLTELPLNDELLNVDPTQLIPGEMYMTNVVGFRIPFILKSVKDGLIEMFCFFNFLKQELIIPEHRSSYTRSFVVSGSGLWLSVNGVTDIDNARRDLLLNEMSSNGFYFDKKRLKLLDVEQWEIKNGHPVIMRFDDNSTWYVYNAGGISSLYSFYLRGDLLPYNDNTKHLAHTTNEPNKKYVLTL